MKSFKSFIREEVDLAAYVRSGKINIDDEAVRDNINTYLNGVTAKGFINPHSALEKISKALAYFHIMVPNVSYLENNNGVEVFPIQQFGSIVGMNDNGQVVTKNPSVYHLYFEYQMGDDGMYKVFAEVVDEKELSELIDDVEDDMEDAGPKQYRDKRLSESVLLEAKKKHPQKEAPVTPKDIEAYKKIKREMPPHTVGIKKKQEPKPELEQKPEQKVKHPLTKPNPHHSKLIDAIQNKDWKNASKSLEDWRAHEASKIAHLPEDSVQHGDLNEKYKNYKRTIRKLGGWWRLYEESLNEQLSTRPNPHDILSQIGNAFQELQRGQITHAEFMDEYKNLHKMLNPQTA